jgi:geranylgeranyl transferase type-2 subunit alpha
LEHNPEVYTAWNWRREVIGPALSDEASTSTSTSSSDAEGGNAEELKLKLAREELDLTERALRRNPKCYSAWHHRRWILLGRPFLKHLLKPELALVDKLLDADSRNFHAWAHRRAVAAEARVSPKEAEEAALRRVEDNFSNYSAWHERSATLLLEEAKKKNEKSSSSSSSSSSLPPVLSASLLEKEFDLVRQAVFTDPEDQAPWLYHRWLLSQSVERFKRAKAKGEEGGEGGEGGREEEREEEAASALSATLEAETEACEELLEAEPDRSKCKWPLLTLARLSAARAWLERSRGGEGEGDKGENASSLAPTPPADAVAIFEQLVVLDPLRKNFYRDAAAGRARFV